MFDFSKVKVDDALADQIIPGHNEMLAKHLESVHMTKAQYLEKMAAAFFVEVGCPASAVELVQQELPWPQVGWKFYFQLRR